MALPLGKLTILIGAGVLGSILAKEGRIPGVSDILSGALKIALNPLKKNDSAAITSKPRNDALISQVNSLRQELQLLASSRPVTIVTSSRTTGGRRFGVIIVIVVLGYGYVWWKGWKLPDFMFASKRGLKDACNSVSTELDEVFHSVKVTQKDLSSSLDELTSKSDDIVTDTAITKDEVTGVCVEVTEFSANIQSASEKIKTLEINLDRFQTNQDATNDGVGKLLLNTLPAHYRSNNLIQDPPSASRPALEYPRVAVSSRTVSLPSAMSLNLPSPSSSNGTSEINGNVRRVVSASGVKESGNAENPVKPCNGNPVSQITEKSPGFLSRTISATRNFKFT